MPSMRLNRLARLAPALVAALVLGACGSVTVPAAATVGGREVSEEELLDEARMISEDDQLRQQQESQGGRVAGDGEGSFDAAFVANLLQVRVYVALLEEELDERDITVGQDDIDAARQRLVQQAGGEEALAGFPADFIDAQVRQDAVITVLGNALVGADAEAVFEEDPGRFAELCVSHIFVSTQQAAPEEAEARATALAAQLDAGTPFEELASTQSDDPAAAAEGGDLGCGGPGRFIPEFEDAAFALDQGEVSDPVQTSVGFHIIRVDRRTERTFEEARDDVAASLQSQAGPAIQEFLVEASAETEVEVNPRFGTWEVQEGQPGRIVPPEGPAPEPTLPLEPGTVPAEGEQVPGPAEAVPAQPEPQS